MLDGSRGITFTIIGIVIVIIITSIAARIAVRTGIGRRSSGKLHVAFIPETNKQTKLYDIQVLENKETYRIYSD